MENENNKELLGSLSINLLDILRDIIRSWWLIIIAGLTAFMLTYVIKDITYAPLYTASTTFVVTTKGSNGTIYSNLTTTTNIATVFKKILDSNVLKSKVVEEVGNDASSSTIFASVIPETNLLVLTVKAPTPKLAYAVILSVMNNYPEVSDYIVGNAVLQVLDSPSVPMAASNYLNAEASAKRAFNYGVMAVVTMLAIFSYNKDTIKTVQDVEKKLDTKLFATVYHERKYRTLRAWLKKAKRSLLISDPTVGFAFVEGYKKIRTSIEHRAKASDLKVLLVGSVMENEGKSTVAANIAIALAESSNKVLLIDGDLRKPSIHKIFGRDASKAKGLKGYISRGYGLNEVLTDSGIEKLTLVVENKGSSNSTELVASKRMKQFIQEARGAFDYVIVDTPPMGLLADAEVLVQYADCCLLVIRESTSLTPDLNDAVDILKGDGDKLLGCVYNNVTTLRTQSGAYGYGYGYGYSKYYAYGKKETKTIAKEQQN